MRKRSNDITKYIDENLYSLVKEIIKRDETGEFYDTYKSKLLEIKKIIESSNTPEDYRGFRSIEQLIITRALEKFIDGETIKLFSKVDLYDPKDNLIDTLEVVELSGFTAAIVYINKTLFFDIEYGRYIGRMSEFCRWYIKKKPRD